MIKRNSTGESATPEIVQFGTGRTSRSAALKQLKEDLSQGFKAIAKQEPVPLNVEKVVLPIKVQGIQPILKKAITQNQLHPRIDFIKMNKIQIRDKSDKVRNLKVLGGGCGTSVVENSFIDLQVGGEKPLAQRLGRVKTAATMINKENTTNVLSTTSTSALFKSSNYGHQFGAKKGGLNNLAENFQTLNITNQNKALKPVTTNQQQLPSSNQKFLYEPAKFSNRDIRIWEQSRGRKWYDLSPKSRKMANQELEIIKAEQPNIIIGVPNVLNQSTTIKINHQQTTAKARI